MKKLIVITFIFIQNISFAQNTFGKKIHFNSINQIGFVGGFGTNGLTIQTINGIRFNNWNVGIGVGIDKQQTQCWPVFADVRRYFGKAKSHPFLYANLGLNTNWKNIYGLDLNGNKPFNYHNTFLPKVVLVNK